MKENVIKATLISGFAAMTAYMGQLIVPIIILAAVMILDYATGLSKSWVRAELSSRTGILGILKKIGYLCIVVVGMAVDWVVTEGCSAVGIDYKFDFLFALIVIIWLILNELISILENVAAIGTPVPNWILKLIQKLKTSVEEKGSEKVEDDHL